MCDELTSSRWQGRNKCSKQSVHSFGTMTMFNIDS